MAALVHKPFDFYNIQKCYTGINCIKNAFKYCLIPISSDIKCICQLLPKRDLPDCFYDLDYSVFQFRVLSSVYEMLDERKIHARCRVIEKDIQPFANILVAKHVTIALIFKTPSDLTRWKKEPSTELIQCILIPYVLTSTCLIVLKKEILNLGLKYICVNATGVGGLSRIGNGTVVEIENIMDMQKFNMMCAYEIDFKLGGLSKQYNLLTSLHNIQLSLKEYGSSSINQKVLVIGPSGCGKTLMVKAFALNKNSHLMILDCLRLSKSSYAEFTNEMKDIKRTITVESTAEYIYSGVSILLLEDIDQICCVHLRNNQMKAMSDHVIKLLEECRTLKIMIIATTSNVRNLDPSVRRGGRLEIEIYIGPHSQQDREEMLRIFFTKYGLNSDGCQKSVAALTPGYVGADLKFITKEVARQWDLKELPLQSESDIYKQFEISIARYKPASLRYGFGIAQPKKVPMSSLGGLTDVKIILKSFIEYPLKHPQAYKRFGLPLPKGILFYGPPGCAKTSLACALADSTKTNFLYVSAAELYSPYVGEAERNVVELFKRARVNNPSIIFIDEIDALVGNRADGNKSVREKVLSTFLTELDGIGHRIDFTSTDFSAGNTDEEKPLVNVLVIGATNRPDKLDAAFIRPGRFDRLVYVGLPNQSERLDILKTVIQQNNMPFDTDVSLEEISEKTESYTGADIVNLLREWVEIFGDGEFFIDAFANTNETWHAGYIALVDGGISCKQINKCHLMKALELVRPSINGEESHYFEWTGNLNTSSECNAE